MLIDRRRRVGGYTLREQIRAGSNGALFRSGNPFGRLAVTLVADDLVPAEAFLRRAEAVAALRHKSIAPLYDFGSDDGCLYLVTKYVDGETLAGLLAAEGRLPPVEAAEIASDILDGLAFAHKKGLVHGGLMPSSVLVSAWSRAMITDLALPSALGLGDSAGKVTEESQGVAAGPHASIYAPPEQLRGGEPGAPSDIYSVGALLFEMLTGNKPVRSGGGEPGGTVMEWPPSRIEAVAPPLEASVLKALATEPGERFSSAAEMRAALSGSSRRRSALNEALEVPGGAGVPDAARPVPEAGPKTAPRHPLSPPAASEMDGPVGPEAGTKAATRSTPPRRDGRAPASRRASRSRRRQYKHEARRPARGPIYFGRWRPVVLAAAVGVSAILALFAVFALSTAVFFEDANSGGQRASTEAPTAAQQGRSSTPYLSGKTVEAAAADLEQVGLRLGQVTSAPSDSVAPDHILEQSPAGGTRIPRNATVDLVVATEPSKG